LSEFNPQVQDNSGQNFDRYSRGGGADRSLGTLFSGIGDAISGGVSTADNYIKNRIEDQARYGLDQLNEGTTAALQDTAGQTSALANGASPVQSQGGVATPGPIKSASQSLQTLAMAREQGKITDEFYYQQLNSQLKDLRSRYPGYEKDVDQIVQQVTGVKPANAYRQALQARIQADAQVMQSSQNKWEDYTKSNAGYIQMAFPDYFSNPDKYAGRQTEIQAGVAKIKGDEQSWDYQVKANTNNQTVLQQKLGDRLSQVGQSLLSGTTKAAGLDLPNFVQSLTNAGKGPGLSPDQLSAMTGQYDQFKFNARSLLMAEANRPELGMISPTQKQQYVDSAMAPIEAIGTMLQNKQYDQAARLAAQNTAMQDQGLADLYKTNPLVPAAVGISKVAPEVGQYVMQQVIQNMGGVQNFIKSTAVADQVEGVVSGGDTLSDVNGRAISSKNLSQGQKNQIVSATVNSSLNTIREGKATPDQVNQFVQNNYNTQKDIFKQVTGDQPDSGQSQYLKLYTKMFDPKITDQVVKSGDQKLINQYFDYAVDKFRSIPEIRAAQNTVTQNINYSDFMRAYYDESKNKIVIEADQGKIDNMGGREGGGTSRIMLQQTVKAASALNQALSVMSPIIEGSGQNEAQTVTDLIGTLGQEGSQKGFLGWLKDSLDRSVQSAQDTKNGSGQATEGTYKEVPLDNPVSPDAEKVDYNIPVDAGNKWIKSTDFTPGTKDDVDPYIRQRAGELGIDPDTASKVFAAEASRVFDPTKQDRGGDDGSSFGPAQLHYAGLSQQYPNAGLGDEFTKATGLDAKDASTWRQQVDFALNYAKQNGWSSWMGARAAGVGRFDGIPERGGTKTTQADTSNVEGGKIITANSRGYEPDTDRLTSGMKAAVAGLQAGLKDILGKDVPVVSGYRDPERNAAAGGAKHSQHIEGDAVDLDVSSLSKSERVAVIQNALAQGFTGIGVYPNSIHIDMGKSRAWGPSFSKDSLPKWASKAIDDVLQGNVGGFRENAEATDRSLGRDAVQGQAVR
jgi:hypothetical protein